MDNFSIASLGSPDLRDPGIPLQSEGCMTYRRSKFDVLNFRRCLAGK